jgi:hypothetical protein
VTVTALCSFSGATVGTPNVGTSGWDHFIIAIMRPAGEPRFDLGPNFDVPNVRREVDMIMRPAGEPRFDLGPNFDVPNVPRF